MRTNVVIDGGVMAQAMKCVGLKTKKAVIEEALRMLIRLKMQEEVRSLRGKLRWKGDLDEMRQEEPSGQRGQGKRPT